MARYEVIEEKIGSTNDLVFHGPLSQRMATKKLFGEIETIARSLVF